jgi:hypothetical protein
MVEYTADVIDKTKIKSQADKNVRSVMDNRSNIADPRDPDNVKRRPLIYDTDPFDRNISFEGVPYIILKMPIVVQGQKSVGGKKGWIMWEHEIIVRAAKQGASNSLEDKGRTEYLQLCDDLVETWESRSIIQSLKVKNMHLFKLEELNSDQGVINNVDVYESTYRLSYRTRMTVSS